MQNPNVVEAINDLIDTFILYGDPKAPYWLLGLEEGDTKGDEQTVEQFLLRTKIKKADRHNHSDSTLSLRELCGVGPQHEDVLDNKSIYLPNYELLAKKNFKIKQQCTWAGYIKLLHAIWNPNSGEKRPWTNEQINHYQAHHLGEPRNTVDDRKSCLMELFALPYQRRQGWLYSELSQQYPELRYLDNKSNYQKATVETRIKQLTTLIETHSPKLVIAFGGDCQTNMCKAIKFETEFTERLCNGKRKVKLGLIGKTWVVFSMHPAGLPGDPYWIELGRLVALHCDNADNKAA